jgi:hypothetical protein
LPFALRIFFPSKGKIISFKITMEGPSGIMTIS